jgi:hypothetical protein
VTVGCVTGSTGTYTLLRVTAPFIIAIHLFACSFSLSSLYIVLFMHVSSVSRLTSLPLIIEDSQGDIV